MEPKHPRKHPRKVVFIPVYIHVDGLKSPLKGEVEDLSEGGAYVRCSHKVSPGLTFKLEFLLSSMRSHHGFVFEMDRLDSSAPARTSVTAEVRWNDNRGIGFGIRFLKPDAKTLGWIRVLAQYLEQTNPEIKTRTKS